MDKTLIAKETSSALWENFFDEAEFPIASYQIDQGDEVEVVRPPSGRRCIMAVLSKVQKGTSLCFEAKSIGCPGGKKYLGYSKDVMPNFEYFLSCGIPGKLEGERQKKSPELVKEMVKRTPRFRVPKRFGTFKRWDKLAQKDNPEVVIFFASPDVLAGLFTLANFDSIDGNRVIAPMSSGCGSIVMYPYLEKN
jgi:uncharacterized protein (DUF169 family)